MGVSVSDRETVPATRVTRAVDLTGHTAPRNLYIGCAGWSVTREVGAEFRESGTHLERYAGVFRSAEINSSFHRSHRRATYERWASSVPATFRFSVKVPKTITHTKRLVGAEDLVDAFLAEATGLGDRLGCLLVQLPPSAEFDAAVVAAFFETLRARYSGDVFVEPRHKTWFAPVANKLLSEMKVSRVAADPAVVPAAAEPGGMAGKVYFRLHGSPKVYYSSYTSSYLDALGFRLRAHARAGGQVWCMFDNTIRGAATANALHLARRVAITERGVGRSRD